jgi:phosphoribosylamine--glycine ligase
MASGGYPGSYEEGKAIAGITQAEKLGVIVFHAGTKNNSQGELVTAGGRVLNVVATGATIEQALKKVYQGVDCIDYEGKYYRRDIGHRLLKSQLS